MCLSLRTTCDSFGNFCHYITLTVCTLPFLASSHRPSQSLWENRPPHGDSSWPPWTQLDWWVWTHLRFLFVCLLSHCVKIKPNRTTKWCKKNDYHKMWEFLRLKEWSGLKRTLMCQFLRVCCHLVDVYCKNVSTEQYCSDIYSHIILQHHRYIAYNKK